MLFYLNEIKDVLPLIELEVINTSDILLDTYYWSTNTWELAKPFNLIERNNKYYIPKNSKLTLNSYNCANSFVAIEKDDFILILDHDLNKDLQFECTLNSIGIEVSKIQKVYGDSFSMKNTIEEIIWLANKLTELQNCF